MLATFGTSYTSPPELPYWYSAKSPGNTIIKARLVRRPITDKYKVDGFAHIHNMPTTSVPDGLKDIIPTWGYLNPVLIVAPTGQGKSTFVLGHLHDYVTEHGGRILIVSNRVALNTQYKRQFLKKIDSPNLKLLTDEGIRVNNEFDDLNNVTFCSYQGLAGLMARYQHGELPAFSHVVFDEAHWFTSDALYAEGAGYVLENAPRVFKKCVRIYMTATPWVVQDIIAYTEHDAKLALYWAAKKTFNQEPLLARKELLVYLFPSLKHIHKLWILPAAIRDDMYDDALIERIKTSFTSEKWLIFAESKSLGQTLAKELKSRLKAEKPDDDKKIVQYLDAESKGTSTWNELVKKSRFDARILITTSVADCGLNIIDSTVKHIVIMSTDRVQFLQELGRKRMGPNETLNVYVAELSEKRLNWLKGKNEALLAEVSAFEQCKTEELHRKRLDEWFGRSDESRRVIPIDGSGRLYLNICADQLLLHRQQFYADLTAAYDSGEPHPFISAVCRWLDIPENSTQVEWGKYDVERKEATLIDDLDGFVDQEIVGQESKTVFGQKIKDLFYTAYGPRKEDNKSRGGWKSNIISKELNKHHLPFQLEIKPHAWILKLNNRF